MDGRVKNQPEKPRQPRKPATKAQPINNITTPEPLELKTEVQGEWVTQEFEHAGHTIIVEPQGRVVVAKDGLYVTEFDHIDKARDHIDGLNDA